MLAAGRAGGGRTAAPVPGVPSIGVVSVVDLLVAVSEARKYNDEIRADQRKGQIELDALAKEIENQDRELATLKPTSMDYLKQAEMVCGKEGPF